MKLILILMSILTPFIYLSPGYQSLPLIFRAYLPAVVLAILFRKRRRWALVYAVYAGLVTDALVAPGIGAYLILHGLMVAFLYLFRAWMPKPSALGLGFIVTSSGYVVTFVFFITLLVLGWNVHPLNGLEAVMMPPVTGLYTWLIATPLVDMKGDYKVLGKEQDE